VLYILIAELGKVTEMEIKANTRYWISILIGDDSTKTKRGD